MTVKIGDIATVDFGSVRASNTFKVYREIKYSDGRETTYFLTHPLSPGVLIEKRESELNRVCSQIKCCTERSLDFVNANRDYLDFNGKADLVALCVSFVLTRKFTPKQKGVLSVLCGLVAVAKLNNDLNDAMELIVENEGLLDEFNRLWYNNFSGLFRKEQSITSGKQRAAIFNMAGFVLAELENPVASK